MVALQSVRTEAVVVGASVGAVEALSIILPALPESASAPIVVVVHVPPRQPSLLVELFSPKCRLPVREAWDKQHVAPGTIWFAPPDYHLLIEDDGHFALSLEDYVNFSRPSIDVLFESAARVYASGLIGVVLSGASGDGALGAQAIRRAGGRVAVQDPSTAESAVLPRLAQEKAAPQTVGTLWQIAEFLVQNLGGSQP